ncbi:MAG TPA: Lrp/AsnC family transcriptional regulator [Ktedonobacterales bacterium]
MLQDMRENRLFTYASPSGLLDEVNIRLLAEIQRDPRVTMAELSRRVSMSAPAVAERVRRLEEQGIIMGYHMTVNPAALGLPIAVFMRVRPFAGQLQQIAELARGIPEVVECHRITGEDCFLIKAYIPAVDQLDRILDRFLQYGSTTTSIVQSSPVPPRPAPLPATHPEP